jgi:hypothetical protein
LCIRSPKEEGKKKHRETIELRTTKGSGPATDMALRDLFQGMIASMLFRLKTEFEGDGYDLNNNRTSRSYEWHWKFTAGQLMRHFHYLCQLHGSELKRWCQEYLNMYRMCRFSFYNNQTNILDCALTKGLVSFEFCNPPASDYC